MTSGGSASWPVAISCLAHVFKAFNSDSVVRGDVSADSNEDGDEFVALSVTRSFQGSDNSCSSTASSSNGLQTDSGVGRSRILAKSHEAFVAEAALFAPGSWTGSWPEDGGSANEMPVAKTSRHCHCGD